MLDRLTGVNIPIGGFIDAARSKGWQLVPSGKKQMLDRELFRMVGIQPEAMKIIVVKSSNHFRADFTPLVGDAATGMPIGLQFVGPMFGDALVLRASRAYEAVRSSDVDFKRPVTRVGSTG